MLKASRGQVIGLGHGGTNHYGVWLGPGQAGLHTKIGLYIILYRPK